MMNFDVSQNSRDLEGGWKKQSKNCCTAQGFLRTYALYTGFATPIPFPSKIGIFPFLRKRSIKSLVSDESFQCPNCSFIVSRHLYRICTVSENFPENSRSVPGNSWQSLPTSPLHFRGICMRDSLRNKRHSRVLQKLKKNKIFFVMSSFKNYSKHPSFLSTYLIAII